MTSEDPSGSAGAGGSAGSLDEGELKPDDEVELLPRPFGGYMLLAVLGHGGMGKVYLAARERIAGIARRCVVKTLRPGFGDDREYVTRFLDEARIVAQLHHRCVCPVFDVGKANGQHYIVMEYIAGRDLRTVLKRARAKGVRVDREMTLHIMGEVLEALDYAHRTTDPVSGAPLALVHRDVSPQNVMIGFEGDVRLIDFGLAASTLKTERTAPNMVMGKVAYMSPEQIYGEQIDGRADQFAAGVMAYELLMGERFYEKRGPREVYQAAAAGRHRPKRFDDLPGDLRVVLDRALAFERDDRYATCGAFRESLVAGRPRADAPTLRKLMETVFAEEILEEKKLVARLASSSSQPVAPAPDGRFVMETSMPASLAPPAESASPASPASPASSTPRPHHDFEDGTVETGSAPTAKARGLRNNKKDKDGAVLDAANVGDGIERLDGDRPESSESIRRARAVTAPDRDISMATPVIQRRKAARLGLATLLLASVIGFVFVMTRDDDDSLVDVPTVPVDVAPVDVAKTPTPPPNDVVTPPPQPSTPTIPATPTPTNDASETREPVVKEVKKPIVKKPSRPPKNALPGAVIRYLEQRCPSQPCAKKLIAHKSDWADLPFQQLKADLDQCVNRCE